MDPLWRTDPVEYLVLWKFPDLNAVATWKHSKKHPLTESERAALEESAEAYRNALLATPASAVSALIEAAKKDDARRYKEHQEQADYSHWSVASYWTLDEAVALSLGKDPRVVQWKSVEPLVSISLFAKTYANRRDLVQRAKVMGQLWDQTIPIVFVAWAERMSFSLPAELTQAIKSLGQQVRDWKSVADEQEVELARLRDELLEEKKTYIAKQKEHSAFLSKLSADQRELHAKQDMVLAARDAHIAKQEEQIAVLRARIADLEARPPPAQEKQLGERERNSLLKLIIGMAVEGYAYDYRAGRSSTAKEIAGDLALAGVPLDEDTIRKYLTEARSLLPSDITEQKS